jgi:hypothetical protein
MAATIFTKIPKRSRGRELEPNGNQGIMFLRSFRSVWDLSSKPSGIPASKLAA